MIHPSECLHGEFHSRVDVYRGADHPENKADRFTAEVHIECVECGTKFQFIGLPGGSSPSEPMCNWDMTEARMPIRPFQDPSQRERILRYIRG